LFTKILIFAVENFICLILIKIFRDMSYNRLAALLLVGVFCMFISTSCSNCSRTQKIENLTIDFDMADLADDMLYFNVSGQVIYALPTPIEASMLIKNWGIPYPELLNDPTNASKYLTKQKMAVNFGVYTTDIICSALYDQAQTVLRYKQAIQLLIEGLGLQSAVDQQMLEKLEENINNKAVLMQIISDIYSSSADFLSDDDRDFYALAILSGGWVEGMYIATNMIDENNIEHLDRMRSVVTDNKLTFDLLWVALSQLDDIPEDAVFLMLDMSYLAHLFGHQTLLSVPKSTQVINPDNITPQFFADLKNHIRLLRQQFTRV